MTDPAIPPERWLPIPGYEGFYEVSDLGRIRSLRHMTRCGWRGGHLLKPFPDSDGYLRVNLSRDGVIARLQPVHRLVLLAFTGPPPTPDHECCHGPGGKLDNRPANLSWGTRLDNSDDKRRDGTMACGEKQGNARFTQSDIEDMRRRYAAGESQSSIARSYDTPQMVIRRIITGEAWSHVPGAAALRPSTGEGHHSAKLTEAIVIEIRQRHSAGESLSTLACEFGVSVTPVHDAVRGKTWRHV